jgi:hypothetical protein
LRSRRDSIKGYLSVITTGRNANGNVVIDAGNKFQAELGLGQDQQATFLPDEVKTELDVGGSTGKVNFEFVSTSGWGQDSTPTFSSIWKSTIETQELKRAAESIDADTGIEAHTELSGEANLYNKFDDVGRCANFATKVVHGGCFVEGTLVTVSSLQVQSTSTDSLWSNPRWLDEPSQETPWLAPERYASVATRTELQVPIESVPIGARVPTKNPNRFEVDPQPEPEQATWAKLSITAEGSDGGSVDAEIIRPRSWILASGLCAGRMLPLNLPELEVSGLALVTAIKDCPPIADGEGSVVTARFVTREVHVVASVDVLGADGTVETITGTTIHPVWSVDRQEWVPLAELAEGETLQGLDGLAVVLSVSLSRVSQAVYNIEVHGEHVYQVGELGVLVHNSYLREAMIKAFGHPGPGWQAAHIIPTSGFWWAPRELRKIQKSMEKAGLIDDVANGFWSTSRHAGTHSKAFIDDLIDIMQGRTGRDDLIEGIDKLWELIDSGIYIK